MFSIEFQMFSNVKGKKKSFFLLIAHTVDVGNKKQNTKKGSPILFGNLVPSWFASWQWENRVLSTNVDIHNRFIMNVQMLCKIQQAERALNSSKRGRKNTESTKMHIVYDTSIGENARVPRLNKCLEISPLLQNQLSNVVLSPSKNQRFEASIFANLHVNRRPRKDLTSKPVETLQFFRVLFVQHCLHSPQLQLLKNICKCFFSSQSWKLDSQVDRHACNKHQTNIGSFLPLFFFLFLGVLLYQSGQLKSLREEIT